MITTLILQNCCYIFLQYHSSLEYWDALHNVFHNFQWVCLSNARLSLLWYLGITFEISFPLSNLGAKGISLSGVCQNSLILKKSQIGCANVLTQPLVRLYGCSFWSTYRYCISLNKQEKASVWRVFVSKEKERRFMRPVLLVLTRCMRQVLCYKYQAIGIAGSNNLY